MSETKTSQVQETQAAWKKLVGDQVARFELGYAEVARMQEQIIAHNKHSIDEMAKLQRESVEYVAQLSAEWRKLTIEATRKAVELATFRG